jgi:hypothetical protein
MTENQIINAALTEARTELAKSRHNVAGLPLYEALLDQLASALGNGHRFPLSSFA